jgi:hypothetical protein
MSQLWNHITQQGTGGALSLLAVGIAFLGLGGAIELISKWEKAQIARCEPLDPDCCGSRDCIRWRIPGADCDQECEECHGAGFVNLGTMSTCPTGGTSRYRIEACPRGCGR